MVAFSFENKKSLGGNIWKVVPIDERKAELVSQRFALPLAVARIVAARGVLPDDVPNFINPKLQNLMPDPFCLKDMEKAAQKIAEAIVQKQKIAIIGDYDVDGATSSSVLRLFLESVGVEPIIHIPERDEGYGPSKQAFDAFEYAKSLNIPVIVLDHHEAEVKLPDVYAVVNPKRLDESNDYPYLKYMAAVGVVFCAIVAINRELRKQNFFADGQEPNLMQWLDLVALGTVCDVVPLLGLNRAFVRQGLRIMSLRSNTGLRALIDKSGISEAPSAFHLGYVLGPRINACGRVGEASLGNKLLCCKDDFQAGMLAEKLNDFNAQRKEIEAYVLLSAIEMLEGAPQEYPIAFAAGKDWHQGVVGIVAGKLKERYNVPAFVMSIEEDEVKGSARSIPGVDLGALIMAAKEKGLLTKGGGHMMAAGFSLEEGKLEDFRKFAGEYVRQKLGDESVTPVMEIDSTMDLLGANVEFAESLEMLEPYGAGNAEPKIVLERVRVIKPGIVGAGHVRCFLTSGNGGSLKAMAFKVADTELGKSLLNPQGAIFDVAGMLRRDTWQGRNSVQFIIEDAIRCE